MRILEYRLSQKLPTIGICLGAQLIAAAAGARVFPGERGKEIGWAPLILTEGEKDNLLASVDTMPVLHWHGDTFDLPAGAKLLASTKQYQHQAFMIGTHTFGIQFHLEVQAQAIESWLIGHASEIGLTQGISVPQIRQGATRFADPLEEVSAKVINLFLSNIAE